MFLFTAKILYLWILFQFGLHAVRATLLFNTSGAMGIFMALAIPLDLPHRKVFVSYNFAASFLLPKSWQWPPAGVTRETLLDALVNDSLFGRNCNNCSYIDENGSKNGDLHKKNLLRRDIDDEAAKQRIAYSLLSRTSFYEILKFKFEETGLQGESCLLRLICETNASHLGQINGVLGNLIHIMFTPTSSQYEALPEIYYEAEMLGKRDQCVTYETICDQSILDLISAPWPDILAKFISNRI